MNCSWFIYIFFCLSRLTRFQNKQTKIKLHMSSTLINFKDKTSPSAHKYRHIRYLLKDIKQQLQTLCTSQLLHHNFLHKTDLRTKIQIYSHCFYETLQCIATQLTVPSSEARFNYRSNRHVKEHIHLMVKASTSVTLVERFTATFC
jgi:hypothetical protein